jgi:hypothetical protein
MQEKKEERVEMRIGGGWPLYRERLKSIPTSSK